MIRLPSDILALLERGGSLIVPSRQRAHAARLAYAALQTAMGLHAWKTPDVLSAEGWLARRIADAVRAGERLPRVLSPAEEWWIWREATRAATGDLELLNRSALAESLRAASNLAREHSIDLSRASASHTSETQLLLEVQRSVQRRCLELRAAPAVWLVEQLLQQPATEALVGDAMGSGFLRLPDYLQRFGVIQRRVGEPLVSARALVAADDEDELAHIAQWCRLRVEADPQAHLLVIIPGAPDTRERLATLIRQTLSPTQWLSGRQSEGEVVAIEGGLPLSDMPLVSHALTSLRWLAGEQLEFPQLSEWLRAPYWNSPEALARARIDVWLRQQGHADLRGVWQRTPPGLAAVAAALQTLQAQLTPAAAELPDRSASPREWSERFRLALERLQWPGNSSLDSANQQTLMRLHELLDEFGQLAAAVSLMSRSSAVESLCDLAGRTAFRPADPDVAVTLTGALVDPVSRYDGIWAAGLQLDTLPEPVEPSAFLSLDDQVNAGITAASARGRLEEANTLLAAWQAATPDLVLSCAQRTQDLEQLPSPLLKRWLLSHPYAPCDPADGRWLALRIHRRDQLQSLDDPMGEAWPAERPLPGGTRSVELQNLCAFRAYAELRLGCAALGAPEPGIAATLRGQLLHAALERLWRGLRDSAGLLSQTGPVLQESIASAVEYAANEVFELPRAHQPDRSGSIEREKRRAERLMRKLCELERKRPMFQVEATELAREVQISHGRLAIRIDRVDRLADGGRIILDYKSGQRVPGNWYDPRPSHPQLLAYLAAIHESVLAMATVNITARKVQFEGVARSAGLLPDVKGIAAGEGSDPEAQWEQHKEQWLATIAALTDEFLAGRAVVDPRSGACDYCEVYSLCRIADRAVVMSGDDAQPVTDDE